MSLLNDALRDLEKRQPKGEAVQPVSPGLAASERQASPRRSRWLLGMGVCLLILLAGAWLYYRFMSPAGRARMHSPPVASSPASAAPAPVAPAAPPPPVKPSPQASTAAHPRVTAAPAKPAAKPVSKVDSGTPAPAATQQPAAPAKAPQAASPVVPRPEPVKPAVAHAAAQSARPVHPRLKHPAQAQGAASHPVTHPHSATASQQTPSVVSPSPQSPGQKDRTLAEHLARLVRQGQVDRAVQLLKVRALDGHDWPKSRKTLVTALLSIQDYSRAKGLLPPAVTRDYPDLRMLKGRLILATQGAKAALRYLQQDIPDLDAWPDYHATLATLFQQTGQPDKAAKVWSALLQLDNANAGWWAGFGIALDSSGHPGRARQAYRQALLLPGLNGALDRYIQSRLAKLPQK